MYSGETALILAARKGHLKILESLLNKGSLVDKKDNLGKIKHIFIYLSLGKWPISNKDRSGKL